MFSLQNYLNSSAEGNETANLNDLKCLLQKFVYLQYSKSLKCNEVNVSGISRGREISI